MPSSMVDHSVGVTTEELSTQRPDGEPWLLVWTNSRLSAFMRLLIVVRVDCRWAFVADPVTCIW
jgi:hypothetical protein